MRRERASLDKHEYDDGEILAMAGSTRAHSLIATNVAGELNARLRDRPCIAYNSDLRIRLAGRRKYVYPDVTVICGDAIADPDDDAGETFTNPLLIVEVLSPSTDTYDRSKKFERYREVPSFREYVLVAQDEARVETFYRSDDGMWVLDTASGTDAAIRLRSLGIDLQLAEVYRKLQLPPPKPMGDAG